MTISGGETRKKKENQRKIKSEMMTIIGKRKKRNPSGIDRMTIGRKRGKRNTKSLTNLVAKTGTRRSLKKGRQGAKEGKGKKMEKEAQKDPEELKKGRSRIVGMPGTRRATIMTRVGGKDMWMATIEDIEQIFILNLCE